MNREIDEPEELHWGHTNQRIQPEPTGYVWKIKTLQYLGFSETNSLVLKLSNDSALVSPELDLELRIAQTLILNGIPYCGDLKNWR